MNNQDNNENNTNENNNETTSFYMRTRDFEYICLDKSMMTWNRSEATLFLLEDNKIYYYTHDTKVQLLLPTHRKQFSIQDQKEITFVFVDYLQIKEVQVLEVYVSGIDNRARVNRSHFDYSSIYAEKFLFAEFPSHVLK